MKQKEIDRKKIVIVGAGGFGREIASWYLDSELYNKKIVFVDKIKKGEIKIGDYRFPIISNIDEIDHDSMEKVFMGVADPESKKNISQEYKQKNIKFSSFVHKSVIVAPGTKISEGTIICPYSVLSNNVYLGKFITVNLCCTIGHDAYLDDFNTLSSHVDITGGCKIGKMVFWGSGSRIIPNISVADRSKIGAGAIVMNKITTAKTIYCMPSKTLKIGHKDN